MSHSTVFNKLNNTAEDQMVQKNIPAGILMKKKDTSWPADFSL